MSYVIMTAQEYVDKLVELARGRSNYLAAYPWNLLYWNGQRFYADCVNLDKALFNGRDITDKRAGSFQADLDATGDCTEWGLMMQCREISTDFNKLTEGVPEVLYMEGHIGNYLGKEVEIDGDICNCVECTPSWQDGIQGSYVDRYGIRYNHKGGTARGQWTHHGKASKWVSYDVVPQPDPVPVVVTKADTNTLAVQIIRNQWGNGMNVRSANLRNAGYTDQEIRAAQDVVNKVVKAANAQKLEAEKQLTTITAAYDVICKAYGDGQERIGKLNSKFGEELAKEIQKTVDSLFA